MILRAAGCTPSLYQPLAPRPFEGQGAHALRSQVVQLVREAEARIELGPGGGVRREGVVEILQDVQP